MMNSVFLIVWLAAAATQVSEAAKDRLKANFVDETQFLCDINGYVVYQFEREFLTNIIDLTENFGYTDWDAFKRDYRYFRVEGMDIEFYRHDHEKGTTKKTNVFQPYELTRAITYKVNIDKNSYAAPSISFATGGTNINTYPVAGTLEMPYMISSKSHVDTLFHETITYRATYHTAKVRVALQVYPRNGHLIIRPSYKVVLHTAGSTVGADLKINTGKYVEFFN